MKQVIVSLKLTHKKSHSKVAFKYLGWPIWLCLLHSLILP